MSTPRRRSLALTTPRGPHSTTVHFVLPNDIDDPATPSGGNVYDRRVSDGLVAGGWTVTEHPVYGDWPHPDAAARRALATELTGLPDGALVVLDGLIASTVPEVLRPHAGRLRLVVLVHMPLGTDDEGGALARAAAVITTSDWSRRRLLERHPLIHSNAVHIAPPGVDGAPLVPGSAGGTHLLCVGAVIPGKGHDRLMAALATVRDLDWDCVCVGSLSRDPAFVHRVRSQARADGLDDRVVLAGPRTGAELDARYAAADLLVLASRGETYGMVATEALARGIPVLATAVGGLTEAIGRAPDGSVPALAVPPEQFAPSLRRWLTDAALRNELRRSAVLRRSTLTAWTETTRIIGEVLVGTTTKVGMPR
jgi:glycosyltransferase involved in cell wall biosynthesis